MIVKKYILSNLNRFDRLYNQSLISSDPKDPIYYSKLAVIEFCGWIEMSMDDIINRSAYPYLKTTIFKQMLSDTIDNVYGFQYKKHFRKTLCHAIGMVKMEKIETKLINNGDLDTFKSQLDNLKKLRDEAAHTWVSGTTPIYPSPSIIISYLMIIYPILRFLYSEVSNK